MVIGIDDALIIAAIAVAAAGTTLTVQAQGKQASAQRKANELQKQAQQEQNAKERRDQIQQERIRIGQQTQAAANQGALNSSSFLGGEASVGSQLNANIGFLNTQDSIATQQTAALNTASKAGQEAGLWAGVTNIATSLGGATTDYMKAHKTTTAT